MKKATSYTEGDLRKKWREVDRHITTDKAEIIRRTVGRRSSIVSRMRARYFAIGVIAISAPLWLVFLTTLMWLPTALIIYYTMFCAIMGLINFFMWYRIGEVPAFMSMPLIIAQKKILELSRLRRNIKYLGWILGFPLIAWLFYEFGMKEDPGIVIGGIIGGVIGGMIGLFIELKNRRQMKDLVHFFNEL